MLSNSNTTHTFAELINAIVADFQGEGWQLTTDHTKLAYFEWLGQKYGLSSQAMRGIWDSWIFRKSKGLGMFDRVNSTNP
jgi:hypothetical protein